LMNRKVVEVANEIPPLLGTTNLQPAEFLHRGKNGKKQTLRIRCVGKHHSDVNTQQYSDNWAQLICSLLNSCTEARMGRSKHCEYGVLENTTRMSKLKVIWKYGKESPRRIWGKMCTARHRLRKRRPPGRTGFVNRTG
jgi:hypothetical protein